LAVPDREAHARMQEMRVRPARAGDGDDLARAWVDGGRYYADLDPRRFRVPEEEGLVDWIESALAKDRGDDRTWIVAEHDGEIVGDVTAHVDRAVGDARWQMMRDLGESILKIDSLMVREHRRRRGVGTALMKAAEEWGRARGASAVFLSTYHDSPSSVPFYERRMRYERASIGFWSDSSHLAAGLHLASFGTLDGDVLRRGGAAIWHNRTG
jgi:GNAT superfamily N-acetyltransferase